MPNFQQILNLVVGGYNLDRKNVHMKDNAFEDAKLIIDEFFKENQLDYKEESKHSHSCSPMKSFLNLINLPDNFFKIIMEYCIENNYITIDKKFEYVLCNYLIKANPDNQNIQITLWIIENFISSEILNEFMFDYNNDKDNTQPIENENIDRKYYSLFQLFYNNQFYDTLIYTPQIFHVFRQKKFNFALVSEKCCQSLIASAIRCWDIYSVRELVKEDCKFDEDCYTSLMRIIRRLCDMRDKIDDTQSAKEWNDGSCSYVEKILYKIIYDDDEMLIKIFRPENVDYKKDDNSEQNRELIKMIETYSDEKLSHLEDYNSMKKDILHDISSYYGRSYLVRPEESLQEIYELFEFCISNGIDVHHECHAEQVENEENYQLEHPTFINRYLHGCKPIQLIYPEYHEKFVKLFTFF
jgi:hypothetical protein